MSKGPGGEGSRQILGIMEMQNKPLTAHRHMGNPASHRWPVRYRTAEGVLTERIVRADPALADAYVAAGKALVEDGARALMATCGFAIAYQQQLAERLPVPVASSSLLALPFALAVTPPTKRVCILTYDAGCLGDTFLEPAGAGGRVDRLHIVGLEGTLSWSELAKEEPDLPHEALEQDVLALLGRAVGDGDSFGAILVECSALNPFTPEIRRRFGLPTFDFIWVETMLLSALAED